MDFISRHAESAIKRLADSYPAVLYGVFADGVLISRKPDTLASKIGK